MSDHRCEIAQRDLDSLRYDLERQIEDLRREVHYLEAKVDSLREEYNQHLNSHED